MHLIIADAFAPTDSFLSGLPALTLPTLTSLAALARHALEETPVAGEWQRTRPATRALLRAYHYPVSEERAATAPLFMLADGLEPGDKVWHVLTPVHYALARDHVTLGSVEDLWADEQEWQLFAALARDIFSAEGGELLTPTPQRWYWHHPKTDELLSAEPWFALGRNVDVWMPGGDENAARLWRRLHNELQMSWYAMRSEARVNGVWCHGSGALPTTALGSSYRHPDVDISIGQALVRGLQCWNAQPTPPVLIDQLSPAWMSQDSQAWCDIWRNLDATWLSRLSQLQEASTLTLCGEYGYRSVTLCPRRYWKNVVFPPRGRALLALTSLFRGSVA